MGATGKLLAWITPSSSGDYVVAFTGSGALRMHGPVTHHSATPQEARQWVESEAAAVGAMVEWLPEFDPAPAHLEP